MKKILLIAPSCFPVTIAEAIVNLKMLKAISHDEEFKIDLITRKYKWEVYPSNEIESYGVKLNDVTTIEVDNKLSFVSFWQILVTFFRFFVYFRGCHWSYPALKKATSMYKKNEYDVVITKNAPSYLVGAYLKRKYGAYWIASWNDPYPVVKYPTPYGKGLDEPEKWNTSAEIRIMKEADFHVFPNDRLRKHMQSYLNFDDKKFMIIAHAINTGIYRRNVVDSKLKLIHSGNLGSHRSPRSLFIALRKFVDCNPEVNIELSILGRANKELEDQLVEYNLKNYVKYEKTVEYTKSLDILANYDVAVIIEADCCEGVFLPTKVSDFMQVGIPIFTISPKFGILHDLYVNNKIAYFATIGDADEICKQLAKIHRDKMNGDLMNKSFVEETYLDHYVLSQYHKLIETKK